MFFYGLIAHLFISKQCSIVCMYHSLFKHPPIEENLDCFQFLEMMYEDAINICLQVFVWMYISINLGKYLRV